MDDFRIDSDVHKWPCFVMSLENCKACSQQISKKAKTCPHCGHKARRTGGCVKIIIVGFVIFVALMIYSSSVVYKAMDNKVANGANSPQGSKVSNDSELDERIERSHQIDFIIQTEKKVRMNFKDPDSVKFRDVAYGYSEETGKVIYGLVNAKNGLGAYTGFVKFLSSGKTTLIENQDPRLKEAWLAVQQARMTRETIKKLPKDSGNIPLIVDIPSLVGKTPDQVTDMLGTPAKEEKIEQGIKKFYKGEKIEIVFIKNKADWITVTDLGKLKFSPSSIKAFSLEMKEPNFASQFVIRWGDVNGLKSVSLFKGKEDFCHYFYVRAYTK